MILLFILLTGLYKKYYAKGYMILSWVGLLFPISRYIVVFVLRNNKAVDYEAYMRAKREEFLRRSRQNPYGPYGGQYGPYNQGGPYGGYNNGPYGGYNNGPYGANGPNAGNQNPGQSAPDDPFSEFAPGASSIPGRRTAGTERAAKENRATTICSTESGRSFRGGAGRRKGAEAVISVSFCVRGRKTVYSAGAVWYNKNSL